MTREQGVNRVVMAVRDLDDGRAFYEELLGCTFHSVDDEQAAAFGVRTVFSWDGGVELVAPIPGADSYLEQIIEERGEGLIGVVWAVADADRAKQVAEARGISAYWSLDYGQSEIDEKLQGRFTRYYEHFLAPAGPLGSTPTVLVGEFDSP